VSTKPVFEKIAKIQMLYVPYNICVFDTAYTMTVIDKITIFCNNVHKTSTSIELLAIKYSMLHVRQK